MVEEKKSIEELQGEYIELLTAKIEKLEKGDVSTGVNISRSKVNIHQDNVETVDGSYAEWENFHDRYLKKHNLKGKTYEEIAREVSTGGFKGKRER